MAVVVVYNKVVMTGKCCCTDCCDRHIDYERCCTRHCCWKIAVAVGKDVVVMVDLNAEWTNDPKPSFPWMTMLASHDSLHEEYSIEYCCCPISHQTMPFVMNVMLLDEAKRSDHHEGNRIVSLEVSHQIDYYY